MGNTVVCTVLPFDCVFCRDIATNMDSEVLQMKQHDETEANEFFATVPDYPNYVATDSGKVISTRRRWQGDVYLPCWDELSGTVTKAGRVRIRPTTEAGSHGVFAHVMICLAFHGPRPTIQHEVNHIDGNPKNNRPDNLEWVTRSENMKHAWGNGLQTARKIPAKLNSEGFMFNSRLTIEQVRYIRQSALANSDLMRELGVPQSTISRIRANKLYKEIK